MCNEGYGGLYCEKQITIQQSINNPICDCGLKWSIFTSTTNFKFKILSLKLGPKLNSITTIVSSLLQSD